MISTLKNTDGYIYAYVIWKTVCKEGTWEKHGEYIFVREMWIHKRFEGTETYKQLIHLIDIHPNTVNAKWVYWKRTKYNERLSPTYSRDRLSKMGVEK